MNRLLDIGFQFAGHWLLEENSLRIAIQRHGEQCNILYAFVCDGDVKYVGKSTQTLRKRMAGYVSPGPTNPTNLRNHRNIREMLASGASVDVFVLPDSGLMHYGPFHLNLAAGLEDSVIATLSPDWNITTRKGPQTVAKETDSAIAKDTVDVLGPGEDGPMPQPDSAADASFEFRLQPTYRNRGFFNGGVASSAHLGADGGTVEIFFGDEQKPILGTINRVATGNNSPRVFGGPALRNRFQTLPELATMVVEVLSPTSIRMRAIEPTEA